MERAQSASSSSDDLIDEICDHFEDAWRRGERPSIAAYLNHSHSDCSEDLFSELLSLDIDYKKRCGIDSDINAYRQTFPQYSKQIEQFTFTDASRRPTVPSAPAYKKAPRRVDRFQLVSPIGSGATGDVWKAIDTRLHRLVAVKLARAEAMGQDAARRFLREAQSAAKVRHPNIVSVYEVGRDEDLIFIVSELVEGTDLQRMLSEHRPDFLTATEICATVAEALHAAHEQGVIHRDLKPANILIDKTGRPFITDFGLAKWSSDAQSVTLHGQLLGTPAYMSPEQARGEANTVDRRSDIFSLSIVLYELLTGRCPFEGSCAEVVPAIVGRDAIPPRDIDASIPRDLETVCLKGMEKSPERRYQTGQELSIDLRRFMRGEVPLARRAGVAEKTWRGIRRRQALTASIVLGLTSLGAFSIAHQARQRNRSLLGIQTVTLATDPPNAEVYFVPLSESNGQPIPSETIKANGLSPVNQELQAGRYLVIARLEDGRFHEVERMVPKNPEAKPYGYSHAHWTLLESGHVKLPDIIIPEANVTHSMVPVIVSQDALNAVRSAGHPMLSDVESFYLDAREFSHGQFSTLSKVNASTESSSNQELSKDAPKPVSFNEAMLFAEMSGARLATENEYLLAAFFTDHSRDAASADIEGKSDKVPGIEGLFDGPSEWTSTTSMADEPSEGPSAMHGIVPITELRVVWDGSRYTPPNISGGEHQDTPPRVALPRDTISKNIGFRLARSAAPRFIK